MSPALTELADTSAQRVTEEGGPQTIWGLEPHQLHDRYWAAHGVQVVRLSQPSEIVPRAELFLLTDPRSLVLFPLHAPIDDLNWLKPHLLFLSIKDRRDRTYREYVLVDPPDADVGDFLGFHRAYDGQGHHLGRVLLTTDPEVARFWQRSQSVAVASRALRRAIHPLDRAVCGVEGSVFDATNDPERLEFLRKLQLTWHTPDVTIPRARRLRDGVFTHHADEHTPAESAITVPPVWIGAGRSLSDSAPAVGPLVIFDDPAARPPPPEINWQDLTTVPGQFPDPFAPTARKPLQSSSGVTPPSRPFFNLAKRLFDIVFSLVALALTLPLYPFILLAIYLEDGRPFFFVHKRETLHGRTFGCIKFRSMRKDAERLKRELAAKNQADGPQFFIEKDPRLTRTGAFLRRYNLDELPQFLNVLLGDMSVVGPRPSPFSENQYCPPWREARLSVRPGVTGLWQVSRTRKAGSDFQEWIKYDLQYVQNANFFYDLKIVYQTIAMLFRKAGHS